MEDFNEFYIWEFLIYLNYIRISFKIHINLSDYTHFLVFMNLFDFLDFLNGGLKEQIKLKLYIFSNSEFNSSHKILDDFQNLFGKK